MLQAQLYRRKDRESKRSLETAFTNHRTGLKANYCIHKRSYGLSINIYGFFFWKLRLFFLSGNWLFKTRCDHNILLISLLHRPLWHATRSPGCDSTVNMHSWNIEHYTSVQSGSFGTLIQLMFSNLCIAQIHPKRLPKVFLGFQDQTTYHRLDTLLKALLNIQDLHFSSGIHIHPPTLEKIACGELLLFLHTLELSMLLPDVVFLMAQKCNSIEGGPSDMRLYCSRITHLQLNLPDYPATKQGEITKCRKNLDLGYNTHKRMILDTLSRI